ncbi:hypothetical protein ZYGM_001391 [Zygosaccharomyces mellis]|uniref:Uncharacterized protein n=1 Tax=Zygosaccharomyces mellis TaxID=42258 RepID=A0A4C2E803_9SACH|nr:hypothetical protein ZYGM_001391 [Zygosaccharomyces mellis]
MHHKLYNKAKDWWPDAKRQVCGGGVNSYRGTINSYFLCAIIETETGDSRLADPFDIRSSKRDNFPFIGPNVGNALSDSIDDVLHFAHVNTTAILHDIESSINSQLNDLQQDLQFLDPSHIFQVIETAVSNLPSELNQFKNQLTSAIQSAVGNLFGIHPSSKRDSSFAVPSDIADSIARTVENTLSIPSVNNTQILHHVEASINSQLNELHQAIGTLDSSQISQIIQKAVSSLPSTVNQFKNSLVQSIQNAISNFFPNLQ